VIMPRHHRCNRSSDREPTAFWDAGDCGDEEADEEPEIPMTYTDWD